MFPRLFNDMSAIDAAAPFLTQSDMNEYAAEGGATAGLKDTDVNDNITAEVRTAEQSTVIHHPQSKDTGISSASSDHNGTGFRPFTQALETMATSTTERSSASMNPSQTNITQSQSQYFCSPCKRTFKMKAHWTRHVKGQKCEANK